MSRVAAGRELRILEDSGQLRYIVRTRLRSAFIAAGLADATRYADQQIAKSRRKDYLSPKRLATYRTLHRLEIGYGEEDVLDLGLPDEIPPLN